jgi:DNA-directed RNA polymerase specialized sigma subunit
MRIRKPIPEGFEQNARRLVELEKALTSAVREQDELIIKLTVEQDTPLAAIAEVLGITSASVSSRRDTALKRQKRRLRPRPAAA